MRKLLTTLCLTLAVLLGSAEASWSAEPIDGICLPDTINSHRPIAGKCSASYDAGDYETAIREFRPLAEQGNAAAQNNLGQIYERFGGVLGKPYYEASMKWIKLAAEQGDLLAQYNLGLSYEYGTMIPKDLKTAMKWYKLAAEQGNPKAIEKLQRLKYE